MSNTKNTYLYIGGERDAAHLEVCRYNAEDGTLTKVETDLVGVQVGAIRVNTEKNILYCTHHVKDYPDFGPAGGGQIVAAKIDPATGTVTEINRQPTFGPMPVMMELDPAGRFLIAANHSQYMPITKFVKSVDGKYHASKDYDDAPTVLYELEELGAIGEACDVYIHGGCNDKTSYPNPHPHCVVRSPLWELYAVCDKGADRVYLFRIDVERKRLSVSYCHDTPSGMAPRYAVFHPEKPLLFTNNELQPVVFSFRYDESGRMELLHTVETLPEGYASEGKAAPMPSDLRIHPTGKYLYTLIRHTDVVVVLGVDDETGALTRLQILDLGGREAKACAVSPDGRFLFVAAKKDNRVVSFMIGDDGKLTPTGYSYETPAPDTFAFYQI